MILYITYNNYFPTEKGRTTGTSGKPSHPDGFSIIGLFTLLSGISVTLVALRQNVRQARKNADTPARLFRFYLDRLKPIS